MFSHRFFIIFELFIKFQLISISWTISNKKTKNKIFFSNVGVFETLAAIILWLMVIKHRSSHLHLTVSREGDVPTSFQGGRRPYKFPGRGTSLQVSRKGDVPPLYSHIQGLEKPIKIWS